MSCTGHPSYWSFWGCGNNLAVRNHVSVTITTSKNDPILPPSLFFTYAGGDGNWAELPGDITRFGRSEIQQETGASFKFQQIDKLIPPHEISCDWSFHQV